MDCPQSHVTGWPGFPLSIAYPGPGLSAGWAGDAGSALSSPWQCKHIGGAWEKTHSKKEAEIGQLPQQVRSMHNTACCSTPRRYPSVKAVIARAAACAHLAWQSLCPAPSVFDWVDSGSDQRGSLSFLISQLKLTVVSLPPHSLLLRT